MSVKIISITVGQWDGQYGSSFNVMGLGDDNKVYRWLKSTGKWELFFTPSCKKNYSKRKKDSVITSPIDDNPF